jgi:hypothetical protein
MQKRVDYTININQKIMKKKSVFIALLMLIGLYSYAQTAKLTIANGSNTTVYVTMYARVHASSWSSACAIVSNQVAVPPFTTYTWNDYYEFEYGAGPNPAVGWNSGSTTFTTAFGSPPPPFVPFIWTDAQFQVTNTPCTPLQSGSATISGCSPSTCYVASASATTFPGGCITGTWVQVCSTPYALRDVTISF